MGPWPRWSSFCRRNFQMCFVCVKCLLWIWSQFLNWQVIISRGIVWRCQVGAKSFSKAIIIQSNHAYHCSAVMMGAIASQITNLTIVYSIVYSSVDQRKHQSSASLAFVREIHRGQVNSPHIWPVTRKMFPFDDVIMYALVAVGLL